MTPDVTQVDFEAVIDKIHRSFSKAYAEDCSTSLSAHLRQQIMDYIFSKHPEYFTVDVFSQYSRDTRADKLFAEMERIIITEDLLLTIPLFRKLKPQLRYCLPQ